MDFGCSKLQQQISFCPPTLTCIVAGKLYATDRAFSKRNLSWGVVAVQPMKAFGFYCQTRLGKKVTAVK